MSASLGCFFFCVLFSYYILLSRLNKISYCSHFAQGQFLHVLDMSFLYFGNLCYPHYFVEIQQNKIELRQKLGMEVTHIVLNPRRPVRFFLVNAFLFRLKVKDIITMLLLVYVCVYV